MPAFVKIKKHVASKKYGATNSILKLETFSGYLFPDTEEAMKKSSEMHSSMNSDTEDTSSDYIPSKKSTSKSDIEENNTAIAATTVSKNSNKKYTLLFVYFLVNFSHF